MVKTKTTQRNPTPRITVVLTGRLGEFIAETQIPDMYYECFEPLYFGDDPAHFAVSSEQVVKARMKLRDNASSIISREIAEFLVNAMKSNDTYNGYSKETR